MTREIQESAAGLSELTGRLIKIKLIEGDRLGSSAFYPAEVLKRDGPTVFTKGTPMYLDHQTAEEKESRPHGSIDTFAGILTTDAFYENDGLYAIAEVFEHQASKIRSMKDHIGVSIRAFIDAEETEIDGKLVPMAKSIKKARSVDFVTKAGAGGKIVEVLESAKTEEIETEENMQEILDAIKGLEARFTAIEEQLKSEPEVVAEVESVDPLEIAEALAQSSLDADGRSRVVALHKATGEDIAKLIEAEESYVGKLQKISDEEVLVEESAKEDAPVDSAPRGVRQWAV